MNHSLLFLVTAVCFLILCGAYCAWANRVLWQKNPPKRKPTMFDVRRLLREGDKETATRLYAQIFKVPLKKAHQDVEELERSLNV